MNIATVYSALTAAIVAASGSLNVWAQSKYTKNHSYIVRFDVRDAPDPSECPCTAISPLYREANSEMKDNFNSFIFHNAVYDTTTSGFTNLETYRKLIEDIVVTAVGALSQSSLISELKVEYDITTAYPYLWAGTMIKIKHYSTLGTNPLG